MKALPLAMVAVLMLVPVQGRAQSSPADGPALSVTGAWHNRYVSEGRDNLGGDDLLSVSGGLQWREWAAGGWFGNAVGQDYREMNLFVERAIEWGALRAYGRFTRLHFMADQNNDNELSAGLRVDLWGLASAGGEYTHSTELDGGFARVSLDSELRLFSGRLRLAPHVAQTYDFGYASPSHDGANNLEASLTARLRVSRRWRLVASIAHSWAQADVKRNGGGDLTWGSVGLATDL